MVSTYAAYSRKQINFVSRGFFFSSGAAAVVYGRFLLFSVWPISDCLRSSVTHFCLKCERAATQQPSCVRRLIVDCFFFLFFVFSTQIRAHLKSFRFAYKYVQKFDIFFVISFSRARQWIRQRRKKRSCKVNTFASSLPIFIGVRAREPHTHTHTVARWWQ